MRQSFISARIKKIIFKEISKILIAETENKKQIVLEANKYACVGEKDSIFLDKLSSKKILISNADNPLDPIQLKPIFIKSYKKYIGNKEFQIEVSELKDGNDISLYKFLERFHYKTAINEETQKIQEETTQVGGRKAVLLAKTRGNQEIPLGYIELQMPLMMCKPRHNLFNKKFNHKKYDIKWVKWGPEEIKKFVNRIVRIARVVVHPEFRGIGLASDLVGIAKEFATLRWHINGKKPIFMEISAEMLNYVDFIKGHKFYLIGKTEGNIFRITKDLESMAKGRKINCGIMSLQQKYYKNLLSYCNTFNKSFDEAKAIITKISQDHSLFSKIAFQEWMALRKILRFPIPYYLSGLDSETEVFLEKESSIKKEPHKKNRKTVLLVQVSNLSLVSKIKVCDNSTTRNIIESFGISVSELKETIFSNISFSAREKNIIFITGSSGSGKSLLLKAITKKIDRNQIDIESGSINLNGTFYEPSIDDYESAVLSYFLKKYPNKNVLQTLARCGLGEPFIFLRKISQLSNGQVYRVLLCDLVLRNSDIWILDEFCANLDPVTAKIITKNLRTLVLMENKIALVAGAHSYSFLDVLKPTFSIVLRKGACPELTQKILIDEIL